jgi:hypothetical protein
MSYKSWRVQEQSKEDQRYIVQVDYNDSEGHAGTCFYGPFNEADANDFVQNWDEDDQELDDAFVIFLNAAVLEETE